MGLTNGRCRATYDGFEEYDIATGKRLHAWDSFGHIGIDESYYKTDNPAEQRCKKGAWDFM